MSSFERVRLICADVAGVDWHRCDQETGQRINRIASTIPMHPNPMRDPKAVERDVDQIIKEIRSLRKRIASLDEYAKSYARRAAMREEFTEICSEIACAGADPIAQEKASARFEAHSKRPLEEWVDFAALRHIDALEAAMQELGARAIELSPTGAGRPRNKHAHDVALAAARAFKELTGDHPTFWNTGSTPFSRMVEALFRELSVKAGLRGPIENAMQKLASDA